MLFSPGWPGYIRGVTAVGAGEFIVTTSNGQVARWRPASGEHEVQAGGTGPLDHLYGIAVAPDGRVVVAEFAAHITLARGRLLTSPLSIAADRSATRPTASM